MRGDRQPGLGKTRRHSETCLVLACVTALAGAKGSAAGKNPLYTDQGRLPHEAFVDIERAGGHVIGTEAGTDPLARTPPQRDQAVPVSDKVTQCLFQDLDAPRPVSYTHLRAHETLRNLECRLLLEKK